MSSPSTKFVHWLGNMSWIWSFPTIPAFPHPLKPPSRVTSVLQCATNTGSPCFSLCCPSPHGLLPKPRNSSHHLKIKSDHAFSLLKTIDGFPFNSEWKPNPFHGIQGLWLMFTFLIPFLATVLPHSDLHGFPAILATRWASPFLHVFSLAVCSFWNILSSDIHMHCFLSFWSLLECSGFRATCPNHSI